MKIALFSDIHANLPALEKVIESIDSQKPDAVYCLGDLVGYNIWPNEVINAIRTRGIPTISGNHDAKVKNLTQSELAESSKNYAYSIIADKEKQYLATLPAHIRIEFVFNNNPLTLLLVHGSPASNEEYLLQDKQEQEFIEIFKNAKCDILCFGHSHKPYHRILAAAGNNKHHYYHAINTGSVGKPKDGNPKACYVLLEFPESTINASPKTLNVRFVRVDYDVEKAATAIEGSPLPNDLADMLRKAY